MSKKKEKEPTKNNELADRILEVMQRLKANGVMETNSTTLRDKLKTKSRGEIRRAMKLLEKDGKVIIGQQTAGKRKRFTYRLAE